MVKDVYVLTTKLPKQELYDLVSQIRRAVISIPSNIAEGSGRGSNKDFGRFLDMAIASSFELETQLYLCFDLEYITEQALDDTVEKVNEVQKLIYGFQKTLKA